MKITITFAVLAAILVAGTVHASEQDLLTGKVRRYASYGSPYRGVCVCQNESANHGEAGHIVAVTTAPAPGLERIETYCSISDYNADGSSYGNALCRPYVPLAR